MWKLESDIMHRSIPEPPETRNPYESEERHPSARQTHSYLRDLMEKRGLHPKNKLGQNFLVDLNLLDLIVRRAELTYDDLALEVGSGTGGLTARLVEVAGAVVSVEVDPAFAVMVREVIPKNPRVALIEADVLKNKNELNPDVLKTMRELQQLTGTTRIKLVANLPYAVATPVIANLLLTDLPIERMIVTVQWEIAERLTASPGTKEYGALAVLVQSLADVWVIRRLPPTVFWPRPRSIPPSSASARAGEARPRRRCGTAAELPARPVHAPPQKLARRPGWLPVARLRQGGSRSQAGRVRYRRHRAGGNAGRATALAAL